MSHDDKTDDRTGDNDPVADVFVNESTSGSEQIQPLDLISLAINDVEASDEERERLHELYRQGGFGGEEFTCQNENEARELVERKLDEWR